MTHDKARKLMWGAAALSVVGTLMPWATIFIVTASGLDTDWGKLAAGLALAGAALLLIRLPWWVNLIAPVLVLGTCAWWIQHLSSVSAGKPNALIKFNVSTGSGVYITIVGALAWLGLAIASRTATEAMPALPPVPGVPGIAGVPTPGDSPGPEVAAIQPTGSATPVDGSGAAGV